MKWKDQVTTNINKMPFTDIEKFIDGDIDEELILKLTLNVDLPLHIDMVKLKTFVQTECCRIGARKMSDLDLPFEIMDDEAYTPPNRKVRDKAINEGSVDDVDIVLPPTAKVKGKSLVTLRLAIGGMLLTWLITVGIFTYFDGIRDKQHETNLKVERTLRTNQKTEYVLREAHLIDMITEDAEVISDLEDNIRLIITFLDAGIDKDIEELLELVDNMPYGSPFKSGHRVTDNYGFRDETWFGGDGVHNGMDLVPIQWGDNAIHTTVDGTIVDFGVSDIYGKYIIFENATKDIRIKYAHLSTIYWQNDEKEVKGIDLPAGTKIGWMGDTGLANGPHLHYELETLVDGEWVLLNPKVVAGQEIKK